MKFDITKQPPSLEAIVKERKFLKIALKISYASFALIMYLLLSSMHIGFLSIGVALVVLIPWANLTNKYIHTPLLDLVEIDHSKHGTKCVLLSMTMRKNDLAKHYLKAVSDSERKPVIGEYEAIEMIERNFSDEESLKVEKEAFGYITFEKP